MKIWFPVIRGGSGTDVFTRRLSDALRRRGVATEVNWFPTSYQLAPFLLRRVPPPPGTSLIHTNSWNGFAFQRPGIPLVVTEHLNVFDPLYGPYKSVAQHLYHENLIRRFVMASFGAASVVTAVSHFIASSLAQTLGVGSAQVIHNWIDTNAFFPCRQNNDSGRGPFRLLFVGNLTRRKGAELLAPIMKELGRRFQLHVASGLRRSKKMRMEPNMVLLGQLTMEDELIAAYRRCDALIFPSRFEGFGLPALEAMACAKPVITTNVSSLPEVVRDGTTGILCPPDDIPAFVAACRKLFDNRQNLQSYGLAARRRAEELFSEEIIIPQYIALYEKLSMNQIAESPTYG